MDEEKQPFDVEHLEFTPRAIGNIEKQEKKMMMEIVSDFSMATLVKLVRLGTANCSEDDAYDKIQEYIKGADNRDVFQMQMAIMDVLEKQGFLSKEIQVADTVRGKIVEMKKKLHSNSSTILG